MNNIWSCKSCIIEEAHVSRQRIPPVTLTKVIIAKTEDSPVTRQIIYTYLLNQKAVSAIRQHENFVKCATTTGYDNAMAPNNTVMCQEEIYLTHRQSLSSQSVPSPF